MSYTAQKLISEAWFLSGIVARNLQGITGDQATNGLDLLNALLNFKQIQTDLIPYYDYDTSFSTVEGQEIYYIAGLADLQTLSFTINNVRFPMQYITPSNYFGSARVNNISSLPFWYTFQRAKGGSNIYVYFEPYQTGLELQLYGKFFLTDVTLDTDLSTTLDTGYIEYLRYALAEYMCSEYGVILNPQSAKKLLQMQEVLRYVSPPDLSNHKSSILRKNTALGWGFTNLYRGYVPGGGR